MLAPCSPPGVLTYQDTSTGHIAAQHRTRLGRCQDMAQNPWNAVLCCGHANGTVTMWTPNMTTPVVKMLCHRAAISALAVDPTGHQLVTAGEGHTLEGQLPWARAPGITLQCRRLLVAARVDPL